MIITDIKSRFVSVLHQTSNILHRQSKNRHFEAKALRIILLCILFFLFSLAANLDTLWAAPTAVDDPYTVIEGETLNEPAPGVLSNDLDLNNNLKIDLINDPNYGTVDLDPNTGSFNYTHDGSETTSDSFIYKIHDPNRLTDPNTEATVTITIIPDNDPPIASDANYVIFEDNVFTIDMLANLSDAEGDILAVILDSNQTSNGKISIGPNTGEVTYTPDDDFYGDDSFTYKANDGGLADSNTATVNITITAVNDSPIARDDLNYVVIEDPNQPGLTIDPNQGVLSNDNDVDGDRITAVLVDDVTHGTLKLDPNNGSFTYIPDDDFNGPDSFTYTANDDTDDSNVATVNILVEAVNDPPIAEADTYETNEDEILTKDPNHGVLCNDYDIDDDTLTVTILSDPNKGDLTFLHADGSFKYDPDEQFEYLAEGETATESFSYKVSDGHGGNDTATVTITINGVNDAPIAIEDTYNINEDLPLSVPTATQPGVLYNDRDVDVSDNLTAVGPENDTIKLDPDGSFFFDPNPNFCGKFTFDYSAYDGRVYSEPVTVTINVYPVNDPPVATVDEPMSFTMLENQSQLITLEGSDPDPNDTLEFRIVKLPKEGILYQYLDGNIDEQNRIDPNAEDPNTVNVIVQDTNHRVVYIPPMYYGKGSYTDEFTYRVNDGNVDSSDGKVNINFTAINNPPKIVSEPNTLMCMVEIEEYNYTIKVEDADEKEGGFPKITAMEMPGWLKLTDHGDNTATLEGRPTFSDICPPSDPNCNRVIIKVIDALIANNPLDPKLVVYQTVNIDLTTPYFDEITVDPNNSSIIEDTVWGEGDCKKVIIKAKKGSDVSSYTVDPNITLTVKAGTMVEFHDGLELNVSGTLRAEGAQGSMIVFTGTNWRGITFSSEDPNTQDPNNYSRLSYCKIEKVNDWFGALTIKNISNLIINNCIITENEAILGGGIYLQDSDQRLENIIISNNNAFIGGGGIYCDNSSPTLINTIITNNSAHVQGGGGIYCDNSSPRLIHSTISKNLSPAGAGIFCASSSPMITNTILYYNNESDSDGNDTGQSNQVYLADDDSDPIFYYCDIQGGRDFQMPPEPEVTYLGAYENNLDSDPQFVLPSPMAGVISGFLADWRLQSTSPCINAGDPASRGEDFDGLERPYNFSKINPNLIHEIFADIGAHEYQNNPPFEGTNEKDPNGYITDEDTQIIITLKEYMSDYYDADPNDDTLYIKINTLPQYGFLYQFDSKAKYRRGDILAAAGYMLTDPNYRIIYVPANRSAEYTVDFSWRVNDGKMDSPKTEKVTIGVRTNSVNESPIFITLPDEIVQAPFDFCYEIEAFDFDEDDTGDTLTIEAEILPVWLVLTDHGDGTATLKGETSENRVGNHDVTIRVTDAHGRYSEQQFTIKVNERNKLSVDAGLDITGAPNSEIILKATGSENDTALYTWKIFSDPNAPADDDDEITGNPVTWKPTEEGIYTAEVTISDQEGSVPATDTTKLIIAAGFTFVDYDNREYPDPDQENKIYNIASVNDIALVSQWDLNLTQRGKVLEAIIETDLTTITQTQTNQIISALYNLAIIDQASESEKLSQGQANQINQMLTILDTIITHSVSLNKMQTHKVVDVLNEMIQYYGNRNLTPGQSVKISNIVKKIVQESAKDIIRDNDNGLSIHNGNYIRISIRQLNLGKEAGPIEIGGTAGNEAKIIVSLGTMSELKGRFTMDKMTANLAANMHTGRSLGMMISASLTGDNGAILHAADLTNPIEIHIPVTDPAKNTPMYFDEAAGIWSAHGISEVSDISGEVIIFKVNHLTDFALFSPQPAGSEDSGIGKMMSKLDEGCFIEAIDLRQ